MQIQAFIDSWQGRHVDARLIADGMASECQTSIVFSEADAHSSGGSAWWVAVPNDWYFGRKLAAGLDRFSGDIFVHVMADVTCVDWAALIRRCRYVFETIPDIGIWTSKITGRASPWEPAKTLLLSRPDLGLDFTTQTDQLVWAMAKDVALRLKDLGTWRTNLGWGCDVAAAAYCHTHGKLVAQDTTVEIFHDHGTRYQQDKAAYQMADFLARMTLPEQLMCEMIRRAHYERL